MSNATVNQQGGMATAGMAQPGQEMNKGKMPPQFMQNKNDKNGDDDDDEKAKKSLGEGILGEEELRKSLDKLETYANSSPISRKEVLLEKAKTEELSADEQNELLKSLGVQTQQATMAEEIAKSLDPAENTDLGDSFDATGYMAELHKSFQEYALELAERVEKSQSQQNELSLVLCKGISDIGKVVLGQARLIKSLEAQVASFGRAPVQQRRTVTHPQQVMQKGFVGQQPGGEQLAKSQILDALEQMHKASAQGQYGQGKGYARCGEDLNVAITKYDTPQASISEQLMQEVVAFRQGFANQR